MTKEAPDKTEFDVRIIERNVKRGLITRKDYEKHLKGLPDSESKAQSFVDPEGHNGTTPTPPAGAGGGTPA